MPFNLFPKETIDDLDSIVYLLDEHRKKTGSFVVHGALEAQLVQYTLKAMGNPNRHNIIKQVLVELENIANNSNNSSVDFIFRSSLTTIPVEPYSMESVFVPRDQKRTRLFLPYILYSLTKLNMNFEQFAVKREIKNSGFQPESVHLAPLIQAIAGYRDELGQIGSANTTSFSVKYEIASRDTYINMAIGLPLLVTRPFWNNSYQATQVYLPSQLLSRITILNKIPQNKSFFDSFSENRIINQTHKAVFIPEQGICYEKLNSSDYDLYQREKESKIKLPLSFEKLEVIVSMITKIVNSKEKINDEYAIRVDFVFTEKNKYYNKEKFELVGFMTYPQGYKVKGFDEI